MKSVTSHLASRIWVSGMLTLLLVGTALPAGAQGREPTGVRELLSRADTVVHGRVAAATSHWNQQETVIYTTVVVDVARTIKGPERQQLSFEVLGGHIGNLKTRVSHMPDFRVGESVVLFLNFADAGALSPLIDGVNGKLEVEQVDGEEVVDSVFAFDITLVSAGPHTLVSRGRAAGGEERIALDDLLRSLEAAASTVD